MELQVTLLARACHLSLFWARSIQSMFLILFLEDACYYFPPTCACIFKWSHPSGFVIKPTVHYENSQIWWTERLNLY